MLANPSLIMTNTQTWYIINYKSEICEIEPSQQVKENNPDIIKKRGTFNSQPEAIARQVGLIRAGKYQPQ
jgi:hypothetical protein